MCKPWKMGFCNRWKKPHKQKIKNAIDESKVEGGRP